LVLLGTSFGNTFGTWTTLWEFYQGHIGNGKPHENSFHYSKDYGMTKHFTRVKYSNTSNGSLDFDTQKDYK
jgi:hypothetical protein